MAGEYLLYMANITGIAVVAALGLNILTGGIRGLNVAPPTIFGIDVGSEFALPSFNGVKADKWREL